MRTWQLLRAFRRGAAAASVLLPLAATSCAPVLGVPRDPENPDLLRQSELMTRLERSFDVSEDDAYQTAGCPASGSCVSVPAADREAARAAKRNDIVLRRVRALNLEFSNFEERLYGDSNVVGTGGDLLLLILNGLGATTGNAGTKAALAAASAGVVGAQAAINKDLFFQRTIPALMAQMEANRAFATSRLLEGLALPDAAYPLIRAELDLDALKHAGSIPSAISTITSQASDIRESALGMQARADKAFIDTRQVRVALRDRALRLGDAQAVALANREIATIALIPASPLRQTISALVPPAGRFQGAPAARQFLAILFAAGRADEALQTRWAADLTQAEGS